ncbi:MAG: acyl-ACP--UDP-N-acetylglucosamine O-acyltransferase [Verrucomicrobia bacterium]|nr:acyl-ACP--UDP-N-acetylglucosamine O-acyltransferase [Verrucomicrobiota bacterium]
MTVVHPSAVVAKEAVLGEGVEVGPFCVVGPQVVIGDGTRLMSHVVLDGRTRIGQRCIVFPFASLGTQTQDLKFRGGQTSVEIGNETTIREYVTVNAGTNEGEVTRVGSGCHIMAYSHVAHACRVGDGVIMANGATLAGEVVVEDLATIGGLVGVHQFVRIGTMCMIGGCSKLTQDCMPYMIVDGNPAKVHGINRIGLQRKNVGEDAQHQLKQAFRIMCRESHTTSEALQKIESELQGGHELNHLVAFIRASERGVIK